LYYERDGQGDELLFVPGWCCDHRFFAPQFDYFKRTHAVTVMSLRGCGRSSATADGYEIASLADDVAWFCARIGVVRPVVVGHSLGGMIGVELGARHPQLARALVAVDPDPFTPPRSPAVSMAGSPTFSPARRLSRSAERGSRTPSDQRRTASCGA